MKKLSDLLRGIDIVQKTGDTAIQINTIQYDSRNISPGDLFVAVKGGTYDGHDYLDAAIRQRANAVVGQHPPSDDRVPYIQVGNTRKALALMASAYYGHPGHFMDLIGITGTNGKTSTAFLIDSILRCHGMRTGLLGTLVYRIGTDEMDAGWTTPESTTLNQLLAAMLEKKTEAVVMELSSHALDQYRAEGLAFRLAVFTNLSQDHLDYHRSMAHYEAAKQRLFSQVDSVKGENIVNGDDDRSSVMVHANHRPVFTYSAAPGKADVFPVSTEYSIDGSACVLHTPKGDLEFHSTLFGKHNIYNIMAAVSAGICLEIPLDAIKTGIEHVTFIPGRLETINEGQPYTVFVDYAHTPDAMEKVLIAIKDISSGEVIVVFGCGGERDTGKRHLMGATAEKYADTVILTSDNPRTEDPAQIIEDTIRGIKKRDAIAVISDRREAIHSALECASGNDCVLILGKGHEPYQLIGNKKFPFDDRQVAREYLRNKFN
jgi:UDP-N-acetylmuramoyl-L-alanyl-D-glutamate--2,6-diaminopimelate ligase